MILKHIGYSDTWVLKKVETQEYPSNSAIIGTWKASKSLGNLTYSFHFSFAEDGTFITDLYDDYHPLWNFDKSVYYIKNGKYEYNSKLNFLILHYSDKNGEPDYDYWYCNISDSKMMWINEDWGGILTMDKIK